MVRLTISQSLSVSHWCARNFNGIRLVKENFAPDGVIFLTGTQLCVRLDDVGFAGCMSLSLCKWSLRLELGPSSERNSVQYSVREFLSTAACAIFVLDTQLLGAWDKGSVGLVQVKRVNNSLSNKS